MLPIWERGKRLMTKMLLSINPEFVTKIFDGSKKFEFRKVKCKNEITSILIYETSPTMKVVGEATIKSVLVGPPEEIWNTTYLNAGISKAFFDKYYNGKKLAIAYELNNIIRYERPKPLSDFGVSKAPQSFIYV